MATTPTTSHHISQRSSTAAGDTVDVLLGLPKDHRRSNTSVGSDADEVWGGLGE